VLTNDGGQRITAQVHRANSVCVFEPRVETTGIDGGVAYRRALEIFDQVKLRPRLLRDMSNVSLSYIPQHYAIILYSS
jgi:hypothetical protein